ncbi:hypothetical protein TNCV_785641 [Trichonephila clavipes]|nr:hypothetical protein TNCV_785641 [Trichonephila clavipes]
MSGVNKLATLSLLVTDMVEKWYLQGTMDTSGESTFLEISVRLHRGPLRQRSSQSRLESARALSALKIIERSHLLAKIILEHVLMWINMAT